VKIIKGILAAKLVISFFALLFLGGNKIYRGIRKDRQEREELRAKLYISNYNMCMQHLVEARNGRSVPPSEAYMDAQTNWRASHIQVVSIDEVNSAGVSVKVQKAGMTQEDLTTCLEMK
jgi:hypothetical protein